MRNLLKALGLLLLLITAQQGAVVHELSHYAAAGSAGAVASGEVSGSVAVSRSGDANKADASSADASSADASRASVAVAEVVADTHCALCPAFAQVLTPAFSHAFHVPLLDRADVQRSPDPRVDAIESAALTPRSRGPPSSS
jgi:hypothetical protein